MRPPRSVYLDFPLGHTAGKPKGPVTNAAIMRAALDAFTAITEPGAMVRLPFEWAADDAWKDSVMRPRSTGAGHSDQRVERAPDPQYQSEDDRLRAQATLARGGCATCIFVE